MIHSCEQFMEFLDYEESDAREDIKQLLRWTTISKLKLENPSSIEKSCRDVIGRDHTCSFWGNMTWKNDVKNLESNSRKIVIIWSLRQGRNTLSFSLKIKPKSWSSTFSSLWKKSCQWLRRKMRLKIVMSHNEIRFFFVFGLSVFWCKKFDVKVLCKQNPLLL